MQTIKYFILLVTCIVAGHLSFSQSLAVNTDGSTASTSAILDVKSNTKGLLVPRMLKSERNSISSPVTGLTVFQTGPDSIGYYFYNGSSWEWIFSTVNGSYWKVIGNSGTNTTNNFIGTIDNRALRFRVNNTWAGQLDNITNTVFFGVNAGLLNSAGFDNVAIGSGALQFCTSGSGNTAIGAQALNTIITGANNTAIGYGADVNAIGLNNATAIGYNAVVTASNSLVLGNGTTNVGIGTTTPSVLFHVRGTGNFLGADTHSGFFYNATSNLDGIELVANSGSDAFMSIQRGAGGYNLHLGKGSSALNQGLLGFYVNGTDIGHVDCDVAGTQVFYFTTSDERLKENIRPTQYGLENLLKIKVADYNYKADTKRLNTTGLLAQQLYNIYPAAVRKGGDDAKTDPWTIDYGRLTPLLVKSLQDQQEIISSQNEKISRQQEEISQLNDKVEKIMKIIEKN